MYRNKSETTSNGVYTPRQNKQKDNNAHSIVKNQQLIHQGGFSPPHHRAKSGNWKYRPFAFGVTT